MSDTIAGALIHFKANVTSTALAAPAHRLSVVIWLICCDRSHIIESERWWWWWWCCVCVCVCVCVLGGYITCSPGRDKDSHLPLALDIVQLSFPLSVMPGDCMWQWLSHKNNTNRNVHIRSEVGLHISRRSNRKHLTSQTLDIIAQSTNIFTTSHSIEACAHTRNVIVLQCVFLQILYIKHHIFSNFI